MTFHNASEYPDSYTVLLLGPTGSGKSHTLNNLFGQEILKIDASDDAPRGYIEETTAFFTANEALPKKLHVVEAPGLSNSDGTEAADHDIKILASVKKFFQQQRRTPNLVIFTLNYTDGGLDTNLGGFIKQLTEIRAELSGDTISTDGRNVVFVLTHLCSAKPKEQRDPTGKIAFLHEIVKIYLGIPKCPIAVAENRPTDYEMKSSDGYFILPNKELFPLNIYQEILRVSSTNDPIGWGKLQEIYAQAHAVNCQSHFRFVPHPPVDDLGFLTGEQFSQSVVPAAPELENKLLAVWETLSLRERNLARLNNPVTVLATKLAILGYTTEQELPKTKKKIKDLFKKLTPDDGMELLLHKAFHLSPPKYNLDDRYLGKSYDLLRKAPMNVVVVSVGSDILAPAGCKFPANVVVSDVDLAIFQVSAVTVGSQDPQLPKLNVITERGSYNSGYAYSEENSELSANYERRLLQLEIKDRATFTTDVEDALRSLPPIYDSSNAENKAIWQEFFLQYGTHYISKVCMGGRVQFEVTGLSNNDSVHLEQNTKDMKTFLNYLWGIGSSPAKIEDSFEMISSDPNRGLDAGFTAPQPGPSNFAGSSRKASTGIKMGPKVKITVFGGDARIADKLEESKSVSDFYEYLSAWEKSILEEPTLLLSSMALTEIATAVQAIRPTILPFVRMAYTDLCGDGSIQFPVTTEETNRSPFLLMFAKLKCNIL